MVRKLIFTALAMALVWWLGGVLYEIWTSGRVFSTAGSRVHAQHWVFYADSRREFLFEFFFLVFAALCGVLSTLGLGWVNVGPSKKR